MTDRSAPESRVVEAERLAQRFHETYERLAPAFDYETRGESAVPWSSVPEKNRNLMVATVAEVVGPLLADRERAAELLEKLMTKFAEVEAERDKWKELLEATNEGIDQDLFGAVCDERDELLERVRILSSAAAQ